MNTHWLLVCFIFGHIALPLIYVHKDHSSCIVQSKCKLLLLMLSAFTGESPSNSSGSLFLSLDYLLVITLEL